MRDYLQGILNAYAVFGMPDEAYDKIGSRIDFFIIEDSDKDYIVHFIRK